MDPVTAMCNAIVAICSLAEKIIDTVPEDVHRDNWERWMKAVDAVDKVADRIRAMGGDE